MLLKSGQILEQSVTAFIQNLQNDTDNDLGAPDFQVFEELEMIGDNGTNRSTIRSTASSLRG